MPYIENLMVTCQNAAFGYDGNITASNLNFTVENGDFLCILGENGSGKTTLLKGILGLLQPMEGKITFSKDLGKKQIGYLSQESIVKKDFPAGVYEIVLSGSVGKMSFRPFYKKSEKEKADKYLDMLGISGLKNCCFRELSGGQQRRVLLARSLCAAEKLLVLDEPFSGLDPLISAELYGLLKKINGEVDMTVIMVSHDAEAADCALKALHLNKKQLFFGSMKEYLSSDIGKNFFVKKGTEND